MLRTHKVNDVFLVNHDESETQILSVLAALPVHNHDDQWAFDSGVRLV